MRILFKGSSLGGKFVAPAKEDERGSTLRVPSLQNVRPTAAETYLFLSVNPSLYTLRGFHVQREPFPETKLISCASGEIFLALFGPNSSEEVNPVTFRLVAGSGEAVLVEPGLATAWITMQPNTSVLYQISGQHSPQHATGYRFDDPSINLEWPARPAVISDRDTSWPLINK